MGEPASDKLAACTAVWCDGANGAVSEHMVQLASSEHGAVSDHGAVSKHGAVSE